MIDKTSAPTKQIVTEIYSRISGYYRPVNQWNKAKANEFAERKYIDVKKAMEKEIPIA